MAPKPPDILVGLSRALLLFDPDGDGECSSRTRFNGVVDLALALIWVGSDILNVNIIFGCQVSKTNKQIKVLPLAPLSVY